MSDFDEWFEINKVTSNRSPDMEGLKDLFEKCWNDSSKKVSEDDSDEIENLKGTIIGIKNEVEESSCIDEAKERVRDYDY